MNSERELKSKESFSNQEIKKWQKVVLFVKGNYKNLAAVLCLWIGFFLCNVNISLLAPFFPEEAKEKGASPTMTAVIISAAPFVVVITSPLVGYLLPFMGLPVNVMIGLLLVGASSISFGLSSFIHSSWGFVMACIFLRMMEGVGTAMFYTATFSVFPMLFPNAVSTMMAFIMSASTLGFTLGRTIGGILYIAAGYEGPFITVGIANFLIAIPCSLLVRRMKVVKAKKKNRVPIFVLFRVSSDLYFIVVAMGMVMGVVGLANRGPVLEPFLVEKLQLNPAITGLIFLIPPSMSFLGNLFLGRIADKLEKKSSYMIIFGLMLSAVGQFMIGIQDYIQIWNVWIICVGIALTGLSAGMTNVPTYDNLIRISKRHLTDSSNTEAVTSYVSGVVSASLSLGQVVGYMLGGVLNSFLSFPISTFVIGELIVAECLLLLGVHIVDSCLYKEQTQKNGLEK